MGAEVAVCNPLTSAESTSIIENNHSIWEEEYDNKTKIYNTSPKSFDSDSPTDRIMNISRSIKHNNTNYTNHNHTNNTNKKDKYYYKLLREENKSFINQYGSFFASNTEKQSVTTQIKRDTIFAVISDLNEDILRNEINSLPIPIFCEELKLSHSTDSSETSISIVSNQ
eukprot:517432_1